ncbi:P-loop containing nucleoside triphosphate hydrolase protein [Annulohypoxylon maeteangense]|uniref:P-loop containing nucleoside triphosphate hydrolase protein n=1 Tax=Annulohypoxylon maeteangense TaxID=1927788 RepID=UPI0020080097|nr:P-loop containing nucleoside triphosphate hydrolase protein [Annulohypoxylon maeteangense]KAI0882897.1 P-loop containing nucleoside triphosphate hydrolase protein [Annulohypoxylon maeteangense]
MSLISVKNAQNIPAKPIWTESSPQLSSIPGHNGDHLGTESSIQRFYEDQDNYGSEQVWNEFSSPALANPKKFKYEGAALQVYNKCAKRSNTHLNRNRGAFNPVQEYYASQIRIQSPLIRTNLESTFAKFGLTYNGDNTAFSSWPHKALFFSREKIAEVAQDSPDEKTRLHCSLLGTEIDEALHDIFEELKDLQRTKEITYKLLWALFRQGSIFASSVKGSWGALRVTGFVADDMRSTLSTEWICFDGFRYGTLHFQDTIQEFPGRVSVNEIPGVTYYDLGSNPQMRDYLRERGRRVLDFQDIHYVQYKPNVSLRGTEPRVKFETKTRIPEPERVVIDSYLYQRYEGNTTVKLLDQKQEFRTFGVKDDLGIRLKASTMGEKDRRPTIIEQEQNRQQILQNEENLLLLNPQLEGLSLKTGQWGLFEVDDIHSIDFDPNIFNHVIHNKGTKELLQTLVQSHNENDYNPDEFIEGKGSSLLVLLTGEPGTGKTLIAESIASHIQRPLVRFVTAEGSIISSFEGKRGQDVGFSGLSKIAKIATDWEAVMLFDNVNLEDDVFRYAFLQQIEYFKGIVVLTSNSSLSDYPAVISRAQIHIKFDSLTAEMRKDIWASFNDRLSADTERLSESSLEKLSIWKMDGRQIRNAMNTTVTWCRKTKEVFNSDAVENIIKLTCPSATKETTSKTSQDLLGWDVEDEQK